MNFATRAATLMAALLLAACGGGAGTTTVNNPATADCDPNDPATIDECGTVYIGITDADGDFVNYTVDVVSLTLETASGRVVETLPSTTRINFTDYVELSELLAARTVPPGTYVAGSITLDYNDAEIFVELGDGSKEAVVMDDSGVVKQKELRIQLSNRDQLRINKGKIAFLQLDFDLEASHRVLTDPTPAEAYADHFILAEVSPIDEKDIRVRGPLANVNVDEMYYVVAIRPFHDRVGDFGRARVYVSDDTEFEVDGDLYEGQAGLRALDAAGAGTPTVAAGTLRIADREFTAHTVLAGSSVPGHDYDTVVGNVIARDGNFLTVRGATLIPTDRRAHFHDDVVVEIGPDTKVYRDGHRRLDLGIDAISVGQRVTIRGNQPGPLTADANAPQVLFDATQGAVRMHVTHLSGIVNTVMTGQTDIMLQSIDRRRVEIFDFSGTGMTSEQDADPDNYEIATGDLGMVAFAEGKPIVAKGFPNAFGMAPPDFFGRTVIDYTDVRAALGVGWGIEGALVPFTDIGNEGLLLDNHNEDIDQRHYIKQGPVLIDLTALDSDTLIAPRETGRMLFVIKTADSLRQYSNFDDFVADLRMSFNGATTARSMFAKGKYDTDTNVFSASKIGILLIEP